ncbi:MAG: hypothetical protein IJ802_00015 [Kiritimatiellae bacterium]|nr:hypothetical protein [Kiritimatiellia bacterium]
MADDTQTWYLRNSDGKIFGPIGLDTLKEWVRDGRVEPFAGISYDLKNWSLAALRAELEMDWVIENEPGRFYGPTHRAVVDDLLRQGGLSEGCRLYRDDHNGALMADVLQQSAEWQHAYELQKATSEAEGSKRAMAEAAAQKAESEAAALRATAVEAKKILETTRSELERTRSELADAKALLAASRKETAFHKKQLEASRDECEKQRTTIASLKAVEASVEKLKSRHRQEVAELRTMAAREMEMRDAEITDLRTQLTALASPRKRHWEAEVVEPEIVSAEAPPPTAKTFFVERNKAGLAALERQAQSELARMGADNFRKLLGR